MWLLFALLILSNLSISLWPCLQQGAEQLSRSFYIPSISNTMMAPSFRPVPSLLKYSLSILPFRPGASWCILPLPKLCPFWGFPHSVCFLRGGSRPMGAPTLLEPAALGRFVLLFVCLLNTPLGRLLPQTPAGCSGAVFDSAVPHLLNAVWNKDLQVAPQRLRVGFKAVIDRCCNFPVRLLFWQVWYRAWMEDIMKLEVREHRKCLFPEPI